MIKLSRGKKNCMYAGNWAPVHDLAPNLVHVTKKQNGGRNGSRDNHNKL